MNLDEMRDVLSFAAVFDRRTVDDDTAGAWLSLMPDVEAADAMQAVREFYLQEEPKRLMPGWVKKRAEEINGKRVRVQEYRRQLAERATIPPPPSPPRTPRSGPLVVPSPYRQWEEDRKAPTEARRRAERPLLDDVDLIEEIEANRARFQKVLRQMIKESPDDPPPVDEAEAEEDPSGAES